MKLYDPALDRTPPTPAGRRPVPYVVRPLRAALEPYERLFIQRALEAHGGNRRKAAEALDISLRLLYYKLRKHGIGGAPCDSPTS